MNFYSLTSGPLGYVLALVAFIVVVFFVNKFNRKMIDQNVATSKASDKMPEIAQKLGLKYEDLSHHKDTKDNIMDVGSKIHGEYKGLPIEIVMHMRADQDKVNIGYKYAYTYKSERFIKLKVENPDKKHFSIMMKNKNAVTKASGNKEFDEKLTMTGNAHLPNEFLDYCAGIGWMNLKLDGENLIFNDNYYDQFQSGLKGMQMLTAVHPIWKTSAKNPTIDVNSAIEFIDKLVELAKKF